MPSETNYEDILSHHGVLGQKWGVIRWRDKIRQRKKDYLINKAPAHKVYENRHKLTDEERSRATRRLEYDKRLYDLSREERRRSLSKFNDFFKNIKDVNTAFEVTNRAAQNYGRFKNALNKYKGKSTGKKAANSNATVS